MIKENTKINSTTTMRAVILTGHGGLDKLVYNEKNPVPNVSEKEVLIQVGACALNNTDINTRVGWYESNNKNGITFEVVKNGFQNTNFGSWDRKKMQFPRIQGASVSGTIVAVGSGISNERIGERVVVDPVIRDMKLPKYARGVEYLGSERDGGFAEYVSVPAENTIKVNSNTSFVNLSTLPCAYQTAEEMQIRADVKSKDIVVVTGASGGVGLANVQLAKLRGAQVIAISSRSKKDSVLEHGADLVLTREDGDIGEQLKATIGERGATVVLDVVGGENFGKLCNILDRAGRVSTAGALVGPIVNIDLRDLIYKDLQYFGVTNPEPEALRNLVNYVESSSLNPIVQEVYSLQNLPKAQLDFASKNYVGKLVIDMGI